MLRTFAKVRELLELLGRRARVTVDELWYASLCMWQWSELVPSKMRGFKCSGSSGGFWKETDQSSVFEPRKEPGGLWSKVLCCDGQFMSLLLFVLNARLVGCDPVPPD